MSLRELLSLFESGQALSLAQISRKFGIEQGVLESMLDFWVRKGKLRLSPYNGCAECGQNHVCPLGAALPRRYELATGDDVPIPSCWLSTPAYEDQFSRSG
jgi:hypothetical protein